MTNPAHLPSPHRETLTQVLARAASELASPESVLATLPATELRREAEALVIAALGLRRSVLYQTPQRELTADESSQISRWLAQRRQGVPLAYLTGFRDFWSLSLAVTPDVLIPRPETELLVEQALVCGRDRQRKIGRPLQVLELGTGSGAVALALASEQPDWRLVATDVSPAALNIAQRNSQSLAICNVEFIGGDWFKPLTELSFDLIISNPPYVAIDESCLAGDSLRHEPQLALTPGPDPLTALRHIIVTACQHLQDGGWLLLEHGSTQAEAVRAELLRNGYTAVDSHADLAGHWRISGGRLDQ